jgi:hypothetical protein
MRKAIIGLVAAATALAGGPLLSVTGNVPQAGARCFTTGVMYCCFPPIGNCANIAPRPVMPVRPVQPAMPVQPQVPHPMPVPAEVPQVPLPVPAPPPVVVPVVQIPKINPPAAGAPRIAALVTPPKLLDAPQQAVAAAKSAVATRINPATPLTPGTRVDFNHLVQNVVANHSGNVEVVKADNQDLTRPRRWNYVDYDAYHRPALYNPTTEAMTFRYFYDGAYREVGVAAGGRALLDVATAGVFPFTGVSDSYLVSGSFNGGAFIPPDDGTGAPPADYTPPPPPAVYQNVSAYVPAANQTVQVGQVVVVGHDDSKPAGSQDTFLLDDNILAWGRVNDPGNAAQITVARTQSLPGVGPTDNGSILVRLVAHEQPTDDTWWLWLLGGGLLVVIAVGVVTWVVIRRKRTADPDPVPGPDSGPDSDTDSDLTVDLSLP